MYKPFIMPLPLELSAMATYLSKVLILCLMMLLIMLCEQTFWVSRTSMQKVLKDSLHSSVKCLDMLTTISTQYTKLQSNLNGERKISSSNMTKLKDYNYKITKQFHCAWHQYANAWNLSWETTLTWTAKWPCKTGGIHWSFCITGLTLWGPVVPVM